MKKEVGKYKKYIKNEFDYEKVKYIGTFDLPKLYLFECSKSNIDVDLVSVEKTHGENLFMVRFWEDEDCWVEKIK